jgi:hypothetical protein
LGTTSNFGGAQERPPASVLSELEEDEGGEELPQGGSQGENKGLLGLNTWFGLGGGKLSGGRRHRRY